MGAGGVSDAELLARLAASLRAFYRVMGSGAPTSRVWEQGAWSVWRRAGR